MDKPTKASYLSETVRTWAEAARVNARLASSPQQAGGLTASERKHYISQVKRVAWVARDIASDARIAGYDRVRGRRV